MIIKKNVAKYNVITCEIKCRIPMAKAAFNKKRTLLLAHWIWN